MPYTASFTSFTSFMTPMYTVPAPHHSLFGERIPQVDTFDVVTWSPNTETEGPGTTQHRRDYSRFMEWG